jgi:hypothetical protein
METGVVKITDLGKYSSNLKVEGVSYGSIEVDGNSGFGPRLPGSA